MAVFPGRIHRMHGQCSRLAPLWLAAVVGCSVLAAAAGAADNAAKRKPVRQPAPRKALDREEESDPAEADAGVQNVFPAAERSLLQLLSKAQQLVEQQRYADAVQCLGVILESPEDAFFHPNRRSQLYPGLKAEAQAMVGRLPPQGRELYELQYGSRARQMLSAAVASGDSKGLADVSRRFFHTRAGYEATLLLGMSQWNQGSPLAAALSLKRLRDLCPIADQFEPGLSLTLAACWLRAGSRGQGRGPGGEPWGALSASNGPHWRQRIAPLGWTSFADGRDEQNHRAGAGQGSVAARSGQCSPQWLHFGQWSAAEHAMANRHHRPALRGIADRAAPAVQPRPGSLGDPGLAAAGGQQRGPDANRPEPAGGRFPYRQANLGSARGRSVRGDGRRVVGEPGRGRHGPARRRQWCAARSSRGSAVSHVG